jgi:glycosyltransferase involved in cell wall biosynthesis
MLQSAEQIVFVSETSKRYFDHLHFMRRPITVFNGVDTEIFRPRKLTETTAELRNSFGLPVNHPVILFVGRFVQNKGLVVLKHMVQRSPSYTWVFAGRGPLDPKRWNASNVHVFSNLDHSGLPRLYQASDVLALPSAAEGFPLVIQEAIASGLPVVCGLDTVTADPALSSLVHGVALHPADPIRSATSFLEVIDNLIDSEPSQPKQAEQWHKFAASRYSWNKAAERYVKVASDLISAKQLQKPASKRY